MYSLKEAAEAVGRSKAAILRSIQKGKISAKRNALNEWEIDPSELHRVYKPITRISDELNDSEQHATRIETEGLHREISLLKNQIDREREISRNLFNFLNEEKEERRKLTLILTNQNNDQNIQKKTPNLLRRIFKRS